MPLTVRSMTFPEMVRFRAERGIATAISAAARQTRTSTSEYLRRAMREKLEADGVSLPPLDGPGDRQVA
ncbi:hypothetical protein [Methylobacterium planeticum]|uniref:Uncharacterized protein n=1 Tax=Methylobacterium planeticum TaxID=2615211 RepID=A0A6N6MC10_9HYPH|nr:hypothetical protein [Methylobacterium planeticum]KAB1068138.1 hypothetical protein F6X51_27180 [Methylobacterium planeticum]